MNLLRLMLLFLFVVVGQPLKAQWRLLYKSQDIIQPPNTDTLTDLPNPIVLIEPRGEWSKYLIVRYAHSKRKLIARNSVWGFTDSTNAIWRYDHHNLCRVMSYNGTWAEYAIYRSRINRNGRPTVWYESAYSRTLDSKIWDHWSEAMADVPSGYVAPRKVR